MNSTPKGKTNAAHTILQEDKNPLNVRRIIRCMMEVREEFMKISSLPILFRRSTHSEPYKKPT